MDDDARRQREARAAARRRELAGGVFTLEDAPPAQLDTPEARLATMWSLAVDAWHMAGRELPTYDRANAPGRVIRPGEPS